MLIKKSIIFTLTELASERTNQQENETNDLIIMINSLSSENKYYIYIVIW